MSDLVDTDQHGALSAPGPNDLLLNHEEYFDDLVDLDISEDQKRELLETLWSIMRLFVEFGYSYDVGGRAVIEIFNQAARGDKGSGA